MSDFLTLTNKVLYRLNEEPLTQHNFASARGLHQTAKQSVLDTVQKINKAEFKWPFNAAEHTMNLSVGVEEYGWPQDFKVVDWNSFYLPKDDTYNLNTTKLRRLTRNDWYNKLKSEDIDAKPDGVRVPIYVFEAHGRGFGVTPSPNEPYEIKFRYFLNPPEMSVWNDTCTIPEEWEYVITAGAVYLMKLFKENPDIAGFYNAEFKEGISRMRSILINQEDYMEDTRIHRQLDRVGSNGR